jgi:hypothetical protein
MTGGRPSSYTPELGEDICARMICGKNDQPESLRSICSEDGMPDLKTVMRWLVKNDEFRQQYASAREAQQEMHQEEIKEIADNCSDDVQAILGNEDDGILRVNHSAIARARLQIDARKWLMSKMAPKKYGDKTVLSSDPENPIPPATVTLSVTSEVVKAIVQQVRDEF